MRPTSGLNRLAGPGPRIPAASACEGQAPNQTNPTGLMLIDSHFVILVGIDWQADWRTWSRQACGWPVRGAQRQAPSQRQYPIGGTIQV